MPLWCIFRVFYKHRDNLFIPAYAQGLAIAIVQIPVSLLESAFFSIVMYFMVLACSGEDRSWFIYFHIYLFFCWQVGFYASASYFFTFYAISVGLSLVASALFRYIGCISPNQVIANAFGGLAIVLLIITSGNHPIIYMLWHCRCIYNKVPHSIFQSSTCLLICHCLKEFLNINPSQSVTTSTNLP